MRFISVGFGGSVADADWFWLCVSQMESEIATFLVGDGPLGHVVDLALGGGR